MNEKKELQVAALENGTVIDHIPSDKVFTTWRKEESAYVERFCRLQALFNEYLITGCF